MRRQFVISVIISSLAFSSANAQKCGIAEGEIETRIFGGERSTRGDWPWLVALINRKYDEFFCGGSLISAKHVLSEIVSPHQVEAFLGKYNLSIENESDSKSHSLQEIVLHPDWKYNQVSYDADIAILVIDEAADFNSFIRSVCLPEASHSAVTGTGTTVGWGLTENSSELHEPTPFKLQFPVIDGDTCYPTNPKLARYSSTRMLCGGYVHQSKATCTGDSGGGFYFPDKRSFWTIRGIVSAGLNTAHGCDVNAYTLYTNVAKFRYWITRVMERTIDWVKVKFNCEKSELYVHEFTYACRLDELTTSSSKFSATFSRDTAETVGTITRASIDFTPLDHVLPGIGEEFTNLDWLRIVGKSVKFVERRDFANMSQLTVLSLQDMPIDFLPDDLLTDLPHLEMIHMVSCKIDEIPEKLFANQKELRQLSLRDNSITVLEKDLFKFNLKLEVVLLERNNLKQIFVDFTKLTLVRLIDLQGNDCMSQRVLNANRNQIESFLKSVTSCCGATASKRRPDKSNCLCFPYEESCQN